VDAFLKLPRPDGDMENLGLSVLDEPKLNQSKRAVLDLMLAEHGKIHRKDYKEVHSIENAHKNQREIQNWVNNVEKIISNRYAPTVAYTKKMPNIDDLMQVSFEKIQKVS
jgi:intraflagellar transport protein 46